MTASFPIPAHVAHLKHWHREPVRIRICTGRGPAHTGIPGNSRETDINPVRIVIGTYPPSSQAGGSWAGMKRCFPDSALPALFSQLIRDTAGILNLIGPFEAARRFFSCGRGFDGCVNPRHLRWATPVENAGDKFIHGTARPTRRAA